MNQYKPAVNLLSYLPEAPELIAVASKLTISHKPVEKIKQKMKETEIRKWIQELILRGHGSPLEHSIYSFEITCSRVTSHQIVRHRIASYTQLSQRYSDKYLREIVKSLDHEKFSTINNFSHRERFRQYSDMLHKFINEVNEWDKLLEITSKAFIIPPHIIHKKDTLFLKELLRSISEYYRLLANGIGYEDARYVLPQSIKTRLIVTMNARELIESFLPLRMCSRAQWEIRYIAWIIWRTLNKVHPEIFIYAGPRCVYFDQRTKGKICPLEKYLNGNCRFSIRYCPERVADEQIPQCIRYASRDPWNIR